MKDAVYFAMVMFWMIMWATSQCEHEPETVQDGSYCGYLQPDGTREWVDCNGTK